MRQYPICSGYDVSYVIDTGSNQFILPNTYIMFTPYTPVVYPVLQIFYQFRNRK